MKASGMKGWSAALLLLLAPSLALAVQQLDVTGHLRVAATHVDGMVSFVNGGWGKYAQDDGTEATLDSAYVVGKLRFADVWQISGAVEAHPETENLALTELFLRYRPLPRSRLRTEVRAGLFYPTVTLTNRQAGWRSRATNSFSAIDTWVAEEVRNTGVEVTASLEGPLNWHFVGKASAFVGNDVSGAQMVWKGWSSHSRQTGIGEEVHLPPFLSLQPGRAFARQDERTEPFLELDDRVGYSASFEIRTPFGARLLLAHWDNRAKPEVFEHGDYAWPTAFDTASLEWRGERFGFIAQWLSGETGMGRLPAGGMAVDTRFRSWNGLLTLQASEQHRVAARYDRFWVSDDDPVYDHNEERGDIWTLSYSFEPRQSAWRYGAEVQRTESWRPERRIQVDAVEDRVSVFVERDFTFGTRR